MVNSSNVVAGKPKRTGGIYSAPLGTTLPTDATTALAEAFVSLGYVSDEGVTRSIERTVENIQAWGGDTVLTTQTEYTETFELQLIETLDAATRKEVFGQSNVTGTLATGMTTISNSSELPERVFVIEMVQKDAMSRIVIPQGKISELGEVSYVDNDAIRYPITITAFPDTNGNNTYEYTKTA